MENEAAYHQKNAGMINPLALVLIGEYRAKTRGFIGGEVSVGFSKLKDGIEIGTFSLRCCPFMKMGVLFFLETVGIGDSVDNFSSFQADPSIEGFSVFVELDNACAVRKVVVHGITAGITSVSQ